MTRIPVLGNGDIWEAEDALRMMRDDRLRRRGRRAAAAWAGPWLFRDLADVFAGREPEDPPDFGGVVDVMLEHARLLAAWLGEARRDARVPQAQRAGTRRASAAARRCASG